MPSPSQLHGRWGEVRWGFTWRTCIAGMAWRWSPISLFSSVLLILRTEQCHQPFHLSIHTEAMWYQPSSPARPWAQTRHVHTAGAPPKRVQNPLCLRTLQHLTYTIWGRETSQVKKHVCSIDHVDVVSHACQPSLGFSSLSFLILTYSCFNICIGPISCNLLLITLGLPLDLDLFQPPFPSFSESLSKQKMGGKYLWNVNDCFASFKIDSLDWNGGDNLYYIEVSDLAHLMKDGRDGRGIKSMGAEWGPGLICLNRHVVDGCSRW